jgi:lysophospholipase L1-like esterase
MPRARKLATVAGALVLALALTAPPAGASGNGGALVVGDSLEVLTSPYLERYLPGVPLTVNAEGGYNSYQILDLFRESYDPSQSVIVFDAGTNDNPAYPQILAGNLAAVAATVGDRCLVVPTIHGFTVDGVDNTGKNRVVEAFAASRPGTQVPDWAGAVATHPELMQADGLHPVPEGADLRARLIARGIQGCLSFISSPPPDPALESGPELPSVGRMARRGESVARAIASELALGLAAQMARRQLPLAAVLTMVSSYA